MNPKHSDLIITYKTIENLKENYRRESISRDKYVFYAYELRQMGYISLANFFSACAHSESIHVTCHSRVALILGIPLKTDVVECSSLTVWEIIQEMLQEEQDAIDDYSNFLIDAKDEHYMSAVTTMDIALKADRTHYDILKKAADSYNYWKNEDRQFYTCALCGYIHEDSRHVCPICGVKPDIFLPFPDDGSIEKNWEFYQEAEARQRQALPQVGGIWYFSKSYPTKFVNSVDFTTVITQTLEKNGWSETEIYGVVLSLTEAAFNANEHGNKGTDGKMIHVECTIGDNFFFCSIQDDGEGFDPKNVPNPCLAENLLIPRGRGLKLINNFMTLVWFNNIGNKIFMLKKR